jgi:hypothetical protein
VAMSVLGTISDRENPPIGSKKSPGQPTHTPGHLTEPTAHDGLNSSCPHASLRNTPNESLTFC